MSELIRREDAIKGLEYKRVIMAEADGFGGGYAYEDGQCDAFTESIEFLKRMPTASPWHRVEDELPPPNKTVLVCNIWRDVNGEPHKVITMDSFTISPSDSVIAWMPLPEPPKEDA